MKSNDMNKFRLIERQENEGYTQHNGFLIYASMHFTERTLQKVAEKMGISVEMVKSYSQNHNWVERASLVDCQRWLEEEEAKSEVTKRDAVEFAKANRKFKDKTIQLTQKMVDVAYDALSHIKPEKNHTLNNIARCLEAAVRCQRIINDLPTSIAATTEIPSLNNIEKLSTAELMALEEKLRQIELEHSAEIKLVG